MSCQQIDVPIHWIPGCLNLDPQSFCPEVVRRNIEWLTLDHQLKISENNSHLRIDGEISTETWNVRVYWHLIPWKHATPSGNDTNMLGPIDLAMGMIPRMPPWFQWRKTMVMIMFSSRFIITEIDSYEETSIKYIYIYYRSINYITITCLLMIPFG